MWQFEFAQEKDGSVSLLYTNHLTETGIFIDSVTVLSRSQENASFEWRHHAYLTVRSSSTD